MIPRIRGLVRAALPASKRLALHNIWRHVRAFGVVRGPWLWYQLRSTPSDGRLIRVRVPGDPAPIFLRPGTSDASMFRQVFLDEEYRMPFVVRPTLIVDGGANVGLATRYFRRIYPQARVVAVEPEASNVALLRKNTAHDAQVRVVHAALWPHPTRLIIQNPDESKSTFQVGEAPPGALQDVGAVTIAQILDEAAPDEIVLLKLDVEGAEKEIFTDSTSWLERVAVIAVELHDRFKPGCSEALFAALESCRFEKYQRGENIILRRVGISWASAGLRQITEQNRKFSSGDPQGTP